MKQTFPLWWTKILKKSISKWSSDFTSFLLFLSFLEKIVRRTDSILHANMHFPPLLGIRRLRFQIVLLPVFFHEFPLSKETQLMILKKIWNSKTQMKEIKPIIKAITMVLCAKLLRLCWKAWQQIQHSILSFLISDGIR